MTRVPKRAEQFIRPPGVFGQSADQAALTDPAGPAGPGPPPAASPGSVQALYPFLYRGALDETDVFEQARMSALAKTDEILSLRAEVCARHSGLMTTCAAAAAARFAAGGRLLTFGNGGSATDAQQLATLFLCPGGAYRPLPALCLACDVAVLTALSNDVGVEVVFARQIAAFGRPNDIAFGLSTSGNSENLLRAFAEAHRRGLMTVGIAGYDGGKMAELDCLDFLFIASSSSVHRIQEAQTTIYQILWELIVVSLGGAPALYEHT
jgi:D-sedoheptulose 7-phosphate isomerase